MPAEACVGHFEHFPALPVAVLMGQLSRLAGLSLAAGAVPYRVIRGSVEAKDLCWAGEGITFRVERTARQGTEEQFSCSATAEGRIVGQMTLVLETVGTLEAVDVAGSHGA